VLALTGCASLQPTAPDYPADLLAPDRFGATAPVPAVDVLAVSDGMRAFLEREFDHPGNYILVFERLMRTMALHGLFTRHYQADVTHTAAETFARRRGNCLSYTSLFVALARELGLDARYQVVEMPPVWDADACYLVRYRHVNVLVRNLRLRDGRFQDMTVDFNTAEPSPSYPRHVISDREATALYYANLAVVRLRAGQPEAAYGYLRQAIQLAPGSTDLWINLGALYASAAQPARAIEAYQVALGLDGRERSALIGLADNHDRLGHGEVAAAYRERARDWRDDNPWYHFSLALAGYGDARYEEALSSIAEAIDLDGRHGRFYFLQALTFARLGNAEAARASFRRAEKLGDYSDLKSRYLKRG
jgi:tetratricopeptide (TPR) repeat protein